MFGFSRSKNPKKTRIYMDNAAATPVSPAALAETLRVSALFGNPGALHAEAREAKDALTHAREAIANACAVKPDEIIFTSGATESNNLAIRGLLAQYIDNGQKVHVVTSAIEHSSVLEVLSVLEEKRLITCTRVLPNAHGEIMPDVIKSALTPLTRLVTIGWANGEIGTMQPLRAISQIVHTYAHEQGIAIAVHTDAGQSAFGAALQPHGVGVDMMSVGSGKLYGPRGVGILYVRHGIKLSPLMHGGAQEQGVRPGTEDPALAAGFACALTLLEAQRVQEYDRLHGLRVRFCTQLARAIPQAVVNGGGKQLPHIVNVSIPNIDSEYVALALDFKGIAISTKSVCVESTGEPESHVVRALGGDAWRAATTLRFSFGKQTKPEDIALCIEALAETLTTTAARSQ